MSASETKGDNNVSSPLNESVHTARGNVSKEIRDGLTDWFKMTAMATGFGAHISRRLVVSEMEVFESKDELRKRQVRIVFEGDVEYGELPRVMYPYCQCEHGRDMAYNFMFCPQICAIILRICMAGAPRI